MTVTIYNQNGTAEAQFNYPYDTNFAYDDTYARFGGAGGGWFRVMFRAVRYVNDQPSWVDGSYQNIQRYDQVGWSAWWRVPAW